MSRQVYIGPAADTWAFGCVIYDAFCVDGRCFLFPTMKIMVDKGPLPNADQFWKTLESSRNMRLKNVHGSSDASKTIKQCIQPLPSRAKLDDVSLACGAFLTQGWSQRGPSVDDS